MIVTIPATGAIGIVADEAAQELPDGAWNDGRNVRFANGYAERALGHRPALTAPSDTAYHVNYYRAAIGQWWVHATLTGLFADDGTTQTDVTGASFTGAPSDVWTSTVLGGVLYVNNQADEPRYWGGDTLTPAAALPGWNSGWRCRAIRSFKANVFALGMTEGSSEFPSSLRWSDTTDPGSVPASWDEADPTGDARKLDLAETSDAIVDGMPMGDVFVVYKDSSTYALQATGGVDVFRYFRLPGDHGALSQNCIASFAGGHCVLTPSDLIVHNGTGPQSIIDGKLRRWLFARLDGSSFRRSFVAHNPARSEIWVCFPESGQVTCTQALIWNYKGNTFGVRDLPQVTAGSFGTLDGTSVDEWDSDTESWDDDTTAWDQFDVSQADKRLILSGAKLYLMDQTGSFDGAPFESRLQRTGMAFGQPDRVKLVRSVRPRIDANTGTRVRIQMGGAMDPERAPTWSPAVDYIVGQSYEAHTFASGRFLAMRILGDSGQWRLKSVDVDVVMKGRY